LVHAENLAAHGSAQLHVAIRRQASQKRAKKFGSMQKAPEIGGPERSICAKQIQ
jgi:hypothetical protein